MPRERGVGGPSAQQGTAAKLESTRVEMAAHSVVRGTGRKAKGLNKRREPSGADPLLSRGKAEPEGRAARGNPADILPHDGLVGRPTVLEPESGLKPSGRPRVDRFDRGV